MVCAQASLLLGILEQERPCDSRCSRWAEVESVGGQAMELRKGGKFAAIGSTVGWLIVGTLLTGAIYTFMIYVLKYW